MNKMASHPVEADLTKKIGQRLRSARQAQGLSLSELSNLTGALSKSRISNYEQGIRRMGLEEAQILANALVSVTPIYLLCLEDSDPLSKEERLLVQGFRESEPRVRETLLKLVEGQRGFHARNPAG
jgi:transcriptional regulator with XRE-family HTH domain